MALQALWSPEQQFQNTNGSILTNGKIYIQYRGRTALAEVFGDASGEHRRANPVILDANGRALCFADDSFSYTAVVCDFYGKELFSFDPIPCGAGSGSSQVTGAPSAHWLGRFGDTRVVSAGQYSDSLPLPANPDYDGSFIESIQGNSNITLATGLYIIDAIVRFRQNPDDLQNLFGQVQVFTGWRDDETTWELRNETGPDSSQEDMHQFRVHLVRHVTGNGDKNFCIQVKTPVNWSWCQIQSLSILSLSSSSGGYGQYIPGDYIQIENDGTINVVGLQPSGNYANAESVAQAFYGVAQDMNALSGQINEVSGQIPSLDGYATQNWVNDQGFLKEVPSEFVTESELNSAISGKADKSEIPSLDGYVKQEDLASYATEEWVRQQNYLTEVPSQYVTESELNSAISGKADKSEIPSLDGYATETYVQSAVSGKQDELEFTYDEENKITTIDGHGIAGTGGGSTYTEGQYISIQNDVISVTGVQPSGEYLVPDDLNGYATTEDVEAAVSGKADKSEIPSLQGYATEEWVGQQGYLTSIPSEYITETELESELSGKADVSAIPSVAGLASETYVDQHIEEATSGKMDSSAYIAPVNADWSATSGLSQILNKPEQSQLIPGSGISIVESGDNYIINSFGGGSTYTEGDYVSIQNDVISVTGLQPSGEYLVPQDLSGYVKQEDLSSYATEQYVQDQTSGFVDSGYVSQYVESQVSGKQDELEFTYNEDQKISAINGSAIAGGSDVPIGVMTESGLKYNAVGEISGYGDSAIAQYGAEKQWLVHDDTILHMSNSAQYAFGVNLSAVAQLLGIDETVLWSGFKYNENDTIPCSESVFNFRKLEIGYLSYESETSATKQTLNFSIDTDQIRGNTFSIGGQYLLSNDWWVNWYMRMVISSNTGIYLSNVHHAWGNSAYSNGIGDFNNNGDLACGGIYKIVGIGRKQST